MIGFPELISLPILFKQYFKILCMVIGLSLFIQQLRECLLCMRHNVAVVSL